jgi:hypothetical protein
MHVLRLGKCLILNKRNKNYFLPFFIELWPKEEIIRGFEVYIHLFGKCGKK